MAEPVDSGTPADGTDVKERARRASKTFTDSVSKLLEIQATSSTKSLPDPSDSDGVDDPLRSAASSAAVDTASSSTVPSRGGVDQEALIKQFGEFLRDMDETSKLSLIKRNFAMSVMEDSEEQLTKMEFEMMVNNLLSYWFTQSRISAEALDAEFASGGASTKKSHARVPSAVFEPSTMMSLNVAVIDRIRTHSSIGGELPSDGIDWAFVVNLENLVLHTPLLSREEIPSIASVDARVMHGRRDSEELPVGMQSEDSDSDGSSGSVDYDEVPKLDSLKGASFHMRISTSDAVDELERELSVMVPKKSSGHARKNSKLLGTGSKVVDRRKFGATPRVKGREMKDETMAAFSGMFTSQSSIAATPTDGASPAKKSARMDKYRSRRTVIAPAETTMPIKDGMFVARDGEDANAAQLRGLV
jgi:hypothetical protein